MAGQLFAAVKPDSAAQVKPGDLIVAGTNFGCGSSREEAPALLKRVGVQLIIAGGFSRLFFRNSINIGLPLLECKGLAGKVEEDDMLETDLEQGVVRNVTENEKFEATKLPGFLPESPQGGGSGGGV